MKNTKLFLLLAFLIVAQLEILAQKFIDGPANIRDKENGVAFLSINNDVLVEADEASNGWFWISFIGNIPKIAVVNDKIVKGTEIVDSNQKVLGKVLVDKKINADFTEPSKLTGFLQTKIWGYTYKSNLKDLSFAEILSKKDIQFADSSISSIVLFNDNGGQQTLTQESDYRIVYAYLSNEFIPIAVKSIRRRFQLANREQDDSNIQFTFYPRFEQSKSFSLEKKADEFNLKTNFLFSRAFGCCGADDDIELASFPDNKTFLTCNTSYYCIEIPDTKHVFYLGYSIQPRSEDSKGTTLGVLNYALDCVSMGKVIFVAKDKSVAEQIVNFTPEIELIAESPNDVVLKGQDVSTLTAWSLKGITDRNKINGVGVKFSFVNESTNAVREIKLLLQSGDFKSKKITIDFY